MFSVMASYFPRQILRHRAALAKPVEHLDSFLPVFFLGSHRRHSPGRLSLVLLCHSNIQVRHSRRK